MIQHDPTVIYKAAILGAGSAGLTMAIGLAGFGHEVVLVEANDVGGDCTNVGCIPSKALLHAAAVGLDDPFGYVRDKRDALRDREAEEMAEHDTIHLARGWGRLTRRSDPHVVEVTAQDGVVSEVRAENIVICSGSRPVEIPIEGLADEVPLTNENLFDLTSVPDTIVMVGGGPISLEMATAFRDLGSRVHIVEMADRVMGDDDPLVSSTIQAALEARCVRFHIATSIARFDGTTARLADGTSIADVDEVLLAVGRTATVASLGLDIAGVEWTEHGIVADSWGRTNVDGIFAVGDCTGNTATTHGANSIARRCIRAIALPLPKVGAARVQPDAVYSRPEIASVGLSMNDLSALPEVGRRRYEIRITDVDRGYTDDREFGVVMVDVERFSGRILRAAIVAPAAAEMIGIFTMAIDHDIGLRKMFGMVHPYPSYAEAIGKLADDFAQETYRALPREWLAMVRGRIARLLHR